MNSPDFILPEGITGFFSTPPTWISIERFMIKTRKIISRLGGEVIGFELFPYVVHTNFSMAVVRLTQVSDQKIEILVNSHYPLMAFAIWDEVGYGFNGPHRFLDIPVLAEEFKDEYTVLTVKDLELPFEVNNKFLTRFLSPRELKRVESFEPGTLGEVVYNFWW